MKTFIRLSVVLVAVAATGCSSVYQSAPKSSVDWQQRAKVVTVGMPRSEVIKLLPPWNGPPGELLSARVATTVTGGGYAEVYWVDENWQVIVSYNPSDQMRGPVDLRREPYQYQGSVVGFAVKL